MSVTTQTQHYTINLTLSNQFLKWLYSHRLLNVGFQKQSWNDKNGFERFQFGGKHGTQFQTVEQVESFNGAFDQLLKQHNIEDKHKHPLWYIMTFLHLDYQAQSILRNRHNHLHDYAKFIIELIADSNAHMERMRKNKDYVELQDPGTLETFFAKKDVAESMPIEELAEYLPDAKHADNVVRYLRITLYNTELYVPNDLVISINTTTDRNIVSFDGAQVNNSIQLPASLQYNIFSYMIKYMLDDHKKYDTVFYRQLIKDDFQLRDLKEYVQKRNKKNALSSTQSLARVGVLVSDYLQEHKIYSSKRSIATFLFHYFALFKALKLKTPRPLPENYAGLVDFYRDNGIDGETIRNLMKDVGEI